MVSILLIFIFSLGALGAAAYALASFFLPAGRALPGRFLALSVCTGYALSYAVSLILVFWSPHWIDNGVEESIFFPDHLIWALWTACVLHFAIVPITVVLFFLVRGFHASMEMRRASPSSMGDGS